MSDESSRECTPLHTPVWHRASSFEDQESVGVVHVEVQYAYAQLTSLTLDVTHVIKSPRRFSMSRSSKVVRIINAYSGGTRLTRMHVMRKIEDEEEISLETCRIDV